MTNSYLLKITLEDVPGPIWRRFVVPADIALDTLHAVIHGVMGWQGGNRHIFMIGRKQYTGRFDVDPEFGDLSDEAYSLEEVLPKSGKFKYFYDITGAWMHRIVVEDMVYTNPNFSQPIYCLEGARACPPDNTYPYDYFCEVIDDPKHEEHESLSKWYENNYGHRFDPDRFEIDEINQMLGKISRSSIPVNRQAISDDQDLDDLIDEDTKRHVESQKFIKSLLKAAKAQLAENQTSTEKKKVKKSTKKKPK